MHLVPIVLQFNSGSNHHIVTPKISSLFRFPTLTDDVIGMKSSLKNGARHLKEHPKINKFTKFDGYQFKPKGMVHLVWIGGTGVLQSILSSLILKVYHAFAFKPITIKFGEFTNFWMLFQVMCPIFNSIDIEYSYQEKMFVPSPLLV